MAYWRDLRAHPALKAIRKVHLPMLFLQGKRDYQVTLEDLAGWKKALRGRRNVHFKVYPKANHLLIDGKGTPTPSEYKKPGHVTKKAIADIASFVLRPKKR